MASIRIFLFRSVVAAFFPLLAACGSDGGGATGPDGRPNPVPTSIVLSAQQQVVFVGETATLQATVRDQFGQSMQSTVTWISADPTIAQVSTQGVITAVDAGIVEVTASAAGLTAKAEVHVRFRVALGEVRLRVRGARDETWQWTENVAMHADYLGSEEAYSLMWFSGDGWEVWAWSPRGPGPGAVQCGHSDVMSWWGPRPQDLPQALVMVGENGSEGMFLPDGGTSWVEFDRVEPPLARSYVEGRLTGRIVFQGERHTFESDDENVISFSPTGERITIHGDFSVPYSVVPMASLTSELVGGPYPGTYEEEASLEVSYLGYYNPPRYSMWYKGNRDHDQARFEVHIPNLGVGTHAIGPTDPWAWNWTVSYSWVAGSIHEDDWTTEVPVASQSGALTIESIVPGKSDELWGEVKGNLSAVLDVYDASGRKTGDVTTWNLTFHAPVSPSGPSGVLSAPWAEREVPKLLKRFWPRS